MLPDAMPPRRVSGAQPLKLQRRLSDPVRIRSNPADFLRAWNVAEEEPSSGVFSIFESEFDRSLGSIRIQMGDESAFSPRDVPKDYGKAVCLSTRSRKARRRHSLHLANSLPDTADPLRQKLVEQFGLFDPVFILKRCSSEVHLDSERLSLRIPPSNALVDKRVSFGADTLAEQIRTFQKRMQQSPKSSGPRPILVRSQKTTEFPLQHMDYNTFKAWRRGSRMSLDVRGAESRPSDDRRSDGKSPLLNVFKLVVYNCFRKK
ncbi:hypothetical protein QR680_017165 [Steinernema hermaphroditum]|uniref:Uncharacterized protein n=1 Tax=Steinernema hermaphroditum TaxID=289476 RepID=A0AA39LNV1_9BILA|nr:hypothetical protein QR680_017165 [Steinernema hermaphroditum]